MPEASASAINIDSMDRLNSRRDISVNFSSSEAPRSVAILIARLPKIDAIDVGHATKMFPRGVNTRDEISLELDISIF